MKMVALMLPYLMLIGFYTPGMHFFSSAQIAEINKSPYHGVAVRFINQYDELKYAQKDFDLSISKIKKESTKQVWPWVFFNRFIGYKDDQRAGSKEADKPYFRKIHGLDLNNDAGALEDFLGIWRISLNVAKELGSPGIVVDPEPYNNYATYYVPYVADQLGTDNEQVRQKLKQLGGKLSDIVNETYPDAVLWFLFTDIWTQRKSITPVISWDFRMPAYIVMGMLDRAKEKNYRFRLVSGGEMWGYCFKNVDDLKDRISKRKKLFADLQTKYPNLQLGGTIAPWADAASRLTWMNTYPRCVESEFKKIEDFRPSLELLLTSYDYVWIYCAGAAPYDPYDQKTAAAYNPTLKDALLNVKSRTEMLRLGVETTGETSPDLHGRKP